MIERLNLNHISIGNALSTPLQDQVVKRSVIIFYNLIPPPHYDNMADIIERLNYYDRVKARVIHARCQMDVAYSRELGNPALPLIKFNV